MQLPLIASLLLVVRPGAPSSVLVPSSDAPVSMEPQTVGGTPNGKLLGDKER